MAAKTKSTAWSISRSRSDRYFVTNLIVLAGPVSEKFRQRFDVVVDGLFAGLPRRRPRLDGRSDRNALNPLPQVTRLAGYLENAFSLAEPGSRLRSLDRPLAQRVLP